MAVCPWPPGTRLPQKIVGSRPRPGKYGNKSLGSRCRVQPFMARGQGASAESLEGRRRLPFKNDGVGPNRFLGSAASARVYPNANSI